MNRAAAGVLAFFMMLSLAFQGIFIPECRDCHVGKLAHEIPEDDDSDCDHCEHLHGSPLGCGHRPVADSQVRAARDRAPQAVLAHISVPSGLPGNPERPSLTPARAFSGAPDTHVVSCGVLRI
ncbi:MAG: hypothetical protein K8T20_03390 [Planctomycetes bacterium]|nr:hypothetical protein [Planctomycetota bacterium]